MYKIIFVIALAVQPFLIQPTVIKDEIGEQRHEPLLEAEIKPPKYKPYKQAQRVEKPVKTAVKKPSGTCESWISAAGITDKVSARELIRRESNCNPNAVNPSSGACNVAQELPCGKSGCQLGDGACSVRWMHRYVLQRYGSWSAALRFHDRNHWY